MKNKDETVSGLLKRVEERYNTPPTKYNKFLPLVQRGEAQVLIDALRELLARQHERKC